MVPKEEKYNFINITFAWRGFLNRKEQWKDIYCSKKANLIERENYVASSAKKVCPSGRRAFGSG